MNCSPGAAECPAVARDLLSGEVIEADAGEVDYTRWRGEVHLVCGGPPCQPFSQAGVGEGAADSRDGWPHAIRAIRETLAPYVLLENVPGILWAKHAAYWRSLIREIEAIGPGYTVQVRKINAADHGVPQRRERVFLIATRAGWARPSWPVATHQKPPTMFSRPWITAGEAVGFPGIETLSATPSNREIRGEVRNRSRWQEGPVGAVKTHGSCVAVRFKRPAPCVGPRWLKLHPPTTLDAPARCVVARHGAGSVNLVEVPAEVVEWLKEPALTVHTDPCLPARGRHDPNVPGSQLMTWRAPWQWRAAWQTFPADWPWRGSQTQIDRQIGNAVPVLLAQRLGESIMAVARTEDRPPRN